MSMAALRSSDDGEQLAAEVVRVSSRCSPMVRATAATPATSCATGSRMPARLSVPTTRFRGSETKLRREDPESGVAQQQRQSEGGEDLRQHRPAHDVADQREIDA